jgi:hypothetical protein
MPSNNPCIPLCQHGGLTCGILLSNPGPVLHACPFSLLCRLSRVAQAFHQNTPYCIKLSKLLTNLKHIIQFKPRGGAGNQGHAQGYKSERKGARGDPPPPAPTPHPL